MIRSSYDKLLQRAAEAARHRGVEQSRHGVVSKVEEKDGERKALVIWGHDPKGKPLEVYASSQEQRSGNHRSQDSLKPGQNVSLQGVNLRQATLTSQAEGKHQPQPKHAPKINGPTASVGKLYRYGVNGGEDDQQEQSGGQGGGGAGGGGGQSGGGQQQKYQKEHFSFSGLAKKPEKLEKWEGPGSGMYKDGGTGSQSGKSQQQPEQKQGQQKEEEEEMAVQNVIHETGGSYAAIGKGDDAVRYAAHEKGAKVRAGKDNYFVAEKDKDSYFYAKKNTWIRKKEGKNFIDEPHVIKKGKDDPVPNHDLKIG